jgi:rhodanese-related sulfurtransferase
MTTSDAPGFARIQASDAATWLAAHPRALVLDARDAAHHAQGHFDGSLRLDGRNHEGMLMREPKDRPVFIYCYRGNASRTYAQMFLDFGFRQVCDLAGGWEAWQRHGTLAEPVVGARPPALPHGNTALMDAAWHGDAERVEALLAQGMDVRATNADGNNALWLACVANDVALVTRLARAGAPIDHQNLTGATCLMYAASSGKPQVVQCLLALGADPDLLTQDDYSALDMAATVECLRLLRGAAAPTRTV